MPTRRPALTLLAAAALVMTASATQRMPQISRDKLPMGLGIGHVSPVAGGVLEFYRQPRFGERPGDVPVADVVKFKAAVPSVDIAEAPPWLVPEHLKMDYEIFHFRVITLTPDWAEVIGNRTTGETWWIRREAIRFASWPEFLLGISSVEAFDPATNPVRARPLEAATVLSTARAALQPLAVQGDWLQVATHALADRMPPEGWIRWRRGDLLLVYYNPLS